VKYNSITPRPCSDAFDDTYVARNERVPLKFIEPADGLKEMDHLFGTFGKAAAFNISN
jgi:hypothetical protein